MGCPDDAVLLGLVEGSLDPESIESVDAHLDSCVICREVVTSLAGSDRRVLHRGDEVGRFVVLERVGEGAMGVVYSAFDPQLDRRVALKLLTTDGPRERLLREARSMARLSHPNVVTVFEVGELGGDVFVAMELVEGTTLRDGANDVLATFRAAGRGLAAAHAEGLVHRDFKPDNVLIDAEGRPKVTDFGLARAEPSSGAHVEGDVSITRTGALLGTPAYMAPEQLRGEVADARSDQFAFCVSLWEALHGERPFEGDSIESLAASIERGPRKPRRRVPRRVHAALLKGLRANPAERHADVETLLVALDPPRSRRMMALTAAAIVGLVGVGFVASPIARPCVASESALVDAWNESIADRIRAAFALSAPSFGPAIAESAIVEIDAWADAWTGQRVAACEATHVRHEQSETLMDRRMACLDRGRDALDALTTAFGAADASLVVGALDAVETLPELSACADIERLGRTLVPAPEMASAVREGFAELEAIALLISAAKHADALSRLDGLVLVDFPPLQSRAHRERARASLGLGRYADARQSAYEALWAAEAVGADVDAAESWLLLAQIAGERGRYDDADHLSRHARAAVERAGTPARMTARLENVLGVLATSRGALDEAETHLERALELREAEHGDAHPIVARVLTNLGDRARLAGDLDEALSLHRRALRIDRAALGEDHPAVGRHLHNVGGVLRARGELGEARDTYLDALRIKREALGNHPETARTLNSLALVAVARSQGGEARARYEDALAIFAAAEHGDEALVRLNLALLDEAEERFEDALQHLDRAEAIDRARYGEQSEQVAHIRLARANALRGLGRLDDAREALRSGEAIARAIESREMLEKATRVRALLSPAARPGLATSVSSMSVSTMSTMSVSTMSVSATSSDADGDEVPAPMNTFRPGGSAPSYGADRTWN